MKKILAVLILSTVSIGSASAIELNVLGGLTMGAPNVTGSTTTYKSGMGLTYGATLGFGMMPGFGIETGVLSVEKKSKATPAGETEDEMTNRAWEIPFLLRFTALPVLSFGAGGYYQLAGKTTKFKDVATGVESEVRTSDFNKKRQDIGLKLNARGAFPVAPAISALLDVSYKMGLTDRDTTAAVTDKNSEIDILAGVSLGF